MGFVASAGNVQALSKPQINSPQRVALTASLSLDYLALYRAQPALRTVIGFLARNIAQIGLHTYERVGDTDRRRVHDHPVAKLLDRPNPWTTHYRFLEQLAVDFFIYDTAYQLKVKTEQGLGLIRLPPAMVTPKGDNWLTPDYFEFRGSKGKREYGREEVLYLRGYGGNEDAGISPIESLRQILRESYAGSEMREQLMRNGARVSGYLLRPASAPKWSPGAKAGFKADWQAQYTGNGPQSGGTPILEDDMTFVEASQNAKELQYVEVRKLTREEVATAYHVSPPMVGILDHATFSNIVELHKMLYQDTLGPPLKMIEGDLALQVIDDLAPGGKIYVEFNIREKLTASFEERSASMQVSVGAPWMTVNEARALDNRPPLEGGDELVRPLNVTQNGDQQPVPAEPAMTPSGDPAEEPVDDEENP